MFNIGQQRNSPFTKRLNFGYNNDSRAGVAELVDALA